MWEAAGFFITILAGAISYGSLRQRVSSLAKDHDELRKENREDVKELRKGVEEINKFLRDAAVEARLRGK